ncbi:hydroquinone glucosyltransferase [Capsicum annuum]|nr:hydroquinone glucosyltransferase [Capsicum annuum]
MVLMVKGGQINSLDFHRKEDLLITASEDDSIRLFDIANGKYIQGISKFGRLKTEQCLSQISPTIRDLPNYGYKGQGVPSTCRLTENQEHYDKTKKLPKSAVEPVLNFSQLAHVPCAWPTAQCAPHISSGPRAMHITRALTKFVYFPNIFSAYALAMSYKRALHPSRSCRCTCPVESSHCMNASPLESLRYLSIYDNRCLRYFKGHKERVVSLCMSPVNDSFMSGSLDHNVRIWDLRVNACQVGITSFME